MAAQGSEISGKVCIVTGATTGIGEAAALELAKNNATVVLVGQNSEKGSASVNAIKAQTGNQSVDFLTADLSSQKDIRRLVEEFKKRHQRLDVLINNAGEVYLSRLLSVDGIEMTFALNHLSYFLLTNLLLDTLIASTPARIINVTSAIGKQSKLNFDDLGHQKAYNGIQAYGQSKLANLFFTYELAQRLEGSGVTVNAVHPGFVASNLGRGNNGFLKPLLSLFHIGGLSPEEAAQSIIYLATAPEMAQVNGGYFEKGRLTPSLFSYDQATAQLLWEVSASMVGLPDLEPK